MPGATSAQNARILIGWTLDDDSVPDALSKSPALPVFCLVLALLPAWVWVGAQVAGVGLLVGVHGVLDAVARATLRRVQLGRDDGVSVARTAATNW